MDELIRVDFSADRLTVSARDLHAFLGVKTRYNDWFPRMCEYGFTEGQDFYSILSKTSSMTPGADYSSFLSNRVDGLPGKPRNDAALTINMAKEICMLQRNERGKQARRYFLQLEKDWNSPEKVMARALRIADAKISALSDDNRALSERIARDAPKVLFADAVSASNSVILIGELAKLLKQNGVADMGQNRLFAWLRENGYLVRRKGTDYSHPT